MENPRSTNEVKPNSIVVNNSLAIDKVSKKIDTLTRLIILSIFLSILGLSGVVVLVWNDLLSMVKVFL